MSPSSGAAVFGAAVALWLVTSACQVGDGSCLRMSDCDTGFACVDGTCRSDVPADTPNLAPTTSKDASSPSRAADAGASDARLTTDGSSTDGNSTADGGPTDAAPDA